MVAQPQIEQPLHATAKPSFFSIAGTVAVSIVKHVPARGVLWGVIGFVLGLVSVALSSVTGLLALGRAASILWYLVLIPIAIPPMAGALLGVHGLHRGVARAALELDAKFGIVRYVVDRVMAFLIKHIGCAMSNLPLAQFERALKAAVAEYLGSDDAREGSGLSGWVIARAKRAIVTRIDRYFLAAYRAEERPDGTGGGVSLERVAVRASAEISQHLATIVMSPLNKQLAAFCILIVTVGVSWWWLLIRIMGLFARHG